MTTWQVLVGDVRERSAVIATGSVQTCITSPPYWGLRDYGHEGQLGLEPTPDAYVQAMVEVFREVKRALRDDGTLWLNLGDSYASGGTGGYGPASTLSGYTSENTKHRLAYENVIARKVPPGLKPKDLTGIPWRVAFALQADGWYLRSDIIWHKPNPMPESVTDRPTKAHEYLFLLTKNDRYYYDADAIREAFADERMGNPGSDGVRTYAPGDRQDVGRPIAWTRGAELGGRNKRSVWTITTQSFPEAHFATYPEALVEPCVLAGSREGDTVLDPFTGSGTTGFVATRLGRSFIGIELNPQYAEMARRRIASAAPLFAREESA